MTNLTQEDNYNTNNEGNATGLPSRLVTTAQKYANDMRWAKNFIDYIINEAGFTDPIYTEMFTLYRAREGKLNANDYEHILNPFKFNEDQANKFRQPAKLKNYPLIAPVADLQLAEFSKRPKIARVLALDSTFENEFQKGIGAIINKSLKQKFVNELNEQGVETEQPSVPEEQISKDKEEAIESLVEELTQQGQDAIDYLKYDLDLEDIHQTGYNDWLTVGTVISYKEVSDFGINYEIIPPYKLSFLKRDNVTFIEDLSEILRRERFTFNELVDRFEFTEEELKSLEGKHDFGLTFDGTIFVNNDADENWDSNNLGNLNSYGYDCCHVQFTAGKKVGIVSYITPIGSIETKDVDDTYVLNKEAGDINIEWRYVNEIWEGWRIEDSIYKKVRLLKVQREEINAHAGRKLSYNGRWIRTKTGGINSLVKTGLNYQYTYNYINFKFEKIMNKNKDKIAMIPLSIIPTGDGWDEDTFMYTADALGFGFYDDTAPGAAAALQGMKVLDMGLADYASATYNLLQQVKQEYWDAIGMNRQRFGNTNSSDGKAVTEQAIFRSSLITEEYSRQYDSFYQSDLNGLLDYSKVAWIKGKKAKFSNSNKRIVTLDIMGEDWLHRDWKIFIGNSEEEARKLNEIRPLAMHLIQNSSEKSLAIDVIDTDNVTDIKRIFKQYDKLQSELAERQQASQEEANKVAMADIEKKAEIAQYKIDVESNTKIKVAEITQNGQEDGNEDNEKQALDRDKLNHTITKDNKDLAQRQKEHNDKINLDNKKLNVQKKSV